MGTRSYRLAKKISQRVPMPRPITRLVVGSSPRSQAPPAPFSAASPRHQRSGVAETFWGDLTTPTCHKQYGGATEPQNRRRRLFSEAERRWPLPAASVYAASCSQEHRTRQHVARLPSGLKIRTLGGDMVIFKCCIQAKLTPLRLIRCVWDIQNAQDHSLTPSWTGVMPYGSLIFSLRPRENQATPSIRYQARPCRSRGSPSAVLQSHDMC